MAYIAGNALPLCDSSVSYANHAYDHAAYATPTLAGLPICNSAYASSQVAYATPTLAGLPICDSACASSQVAYAEAPVAAAYPYAAAAAPAIPAIPAVPAAQLAAPLATAHFAYNGVAKARTLAASAKAAAANSAAAAEAANRAAAAAQARYKAAIEYAERKDAKLQKDLDEVHISHSRIARQVTYPCLGH